MSTDYSAAAKFAYAAVIGREELPAADAFRVAGLEQMGDFWLRPGLSIRDRRLVTLAVIAALGVERELTVHMGAALRMCDLRPEEIEELCVQVAGYAGWPRGSMARECLRRLTAVADDGELT